MLDDLVEGAIDIGLMALEGSEAKDRKGARQGLLLNLLGLFMLAAALGCVVGFFATQSGWWLAGGGVALLISIAAFIYSFYVRRVCGT